MVSKTKTNYIISLQKKKVRNEEGVFVIEGDKIVKDFLSAKISLKALFALPDFINGLTPGMKKLSGEIEMVNDEELKRISTLKSPHNAIAVVPMFNNEYNEKNLGSGLSVALDFVQDPGNLGTVIRSAAWFGIKNIYCSEDCVDLYNPKVIQASMGAVLHVNVFYTDLKKLLGSAASQNVRVYGALIEGEPVYSKKLDNGIILLGNESKGISSGLLQFITDRIMIPKFNSAKYGIDSLNVSMAAAVIFSEFKRRSESR